ncbi:MAG: GDP-mannose 4,6-dehydratase [bacterium]
MKTILVTGGAGFIGSNFVKYILKKYSDYKVIILDALTYAGNLDNFPKCLKNNSRLVFWQGSIRNSDLVNELVSQSDIVVHLAAETHVARSIYDDTTFFETDVLGTQTIANAVVKHHVEKFIHISSSEVYGTALASEMDEDHPLMPTTPYASAKAGADRLVYSYFISYDIPAVIVRPFNNYGPYQHLEKVIPRFITNAILNEPIIVHGDGSNSRDWLFVQDHCMAIDKIIHTNTEKIKGMVINLGTGRDINIVNIAQTILKKMPQSHSNIQFIDDRPGQVKRHTSSIQKAGHLLDWKAETGFEKGIEETIGWYTENQDWWEKLLWMRSIPIKTTNGKRTFYY